MTSHRNEDTEVKSCYLLGSNIKPERISSHEIHWILTLDRVSMKGLEKIFWGHVVTIYTKITIVQTIVFSVTLHWSKFWTSRKQDRGSTDAFICWYCQIPDNTMDSQKTETKRSYNNQPRILTRDINYQVQIITITLLWDT